MKLKILKLPIFFFFFCGENDQGKGKNNLKLSRVRKNNKIIKNVMKKCIENHGYDEWATEVKERVDNIGGLAKHGAFYHTECSVRFRHKKSK